MHCFDRNYQRKKSLENISLLVRPARIRTGLVFERPGVNVFPEMFWDKFLHQDILGQLGHPVAQRVRIGQVERDRIFLTELSERSEEHTSELQSQSNLVC